MNTTDSDKRTHFKPELTSFPYAVWAWVGVLVRAIVHACGRMSRWPWQGRSRL